MDTSEDTMLGLQCEGTRQRVREVTGRIVEYIRRKYSYWQDCSDEDLRGWLTWHWCQGLVIVMEDPMDGRICALVIARLFDEPKGFETAYLHNPNGRICYVELAISDEPMALKAAIDLFQLRHGVPVYIMHERASRGLGVRLRLWKRYGALLEKQNGFRS